MKFLDLFAGIGGFRRGLERSGHTCIGHVEIDKYANKSYMAMYRLETCPYPNSTVSRGRVGSQCAQTLLTGGSMGVMVCCRLRRLTPRECWRLQSFEDFLFDRARAAGISDAQLYKQAGNAVTVNVVYEIGLRLAEIGGGT